MVFSIHFRKCEAIGVHSDMDWACCLRSRKSTPGGCAMLGTHMTKASSATEASLALSSGDAEYYGVLRATGIGLCLQALLGHVGVCLPLGVWTDSEAAMGTAGRRGLGKLRHLECHSLWLR